MRRDTRRDARRRTRRLASGLSLLVIVAASMIACDRGSATDPLAIGPGSEQPPPAEAVLDEEAGAEPGWAPDVPAVSQPHATDQARLATLDLASAAAVDAPLGEGATGSTPETGPGGSVTYVGTMNIEIAYYNYCQTYDGNLGYAGSAQFEMDAEVYVNPPAEDGGVRERSPFNLIVATETGVEGSMLLMSGQVVRNTLTDETVLIDYWDIGQDPDGSIGGTLTDRWPGLAFNYIVTAQPIVPCQPDLVLALKDDIAEGAELTGTVSPDHIHIEVLAQSLDREVRFLGVIDADVAA